MNTVSKADNKGYKMWLYDRYLGWRKIYQIKHLYNDLYSVSFFSDNKNYEYSAYGDEFVYDDYPLGD